MLTQMAMADWTRLHVNHALGLIPDSVMVGGVAGVSRTFSSRRSAGLLIASEYGLEERHR